jgi:hypothetical protein
LDAFFCKNTTTTKQQQWDRLKTVVKICATKYAAFNNRDHHKRLKDLQRQRQQLLREAGFQPTTEERDAIKELEDTIDKEMTLDTERLIVRSQTRWEEKGERSNKYFFRVLKQRAQQSSLTSIRNPDTNQIHHTPVAMIQEASRFYTVLYTPTPSDGSETQQLLAQVPSQSLSPNQKEQLTALMDHDYLASIVAHSPNRRSPGLDGLSFELYKFVVANHEPTADLLLEVMNDALSGTFPASWKETKMVLLFKKGDRDLLANWRPLSMINCDAKLFTKAITNRLHQCIPTTDRGLSNWFHPGTAHIRQRLDHSSADEAPSTHSSQRPYCGRAT